MSLRLQILDDPATVPATAWNALLACQRTPTPFMRHDYLTALHTSGSAVPDTGWAPRFHLLWDGDALAAACPLYVKAHSYGEYVFDFAWAQAYAEHGLDYYPKALVAVPFTPVPGSRLLARDATARAALLGALLATCQDQRLPSLHLLFGDADDLAACDAAGLLGRQQLQFHWQNHAPAPSSPAAQPELAQPGTGAPFASFDDFLAALSQDKRKKIRQERRKVAQAGIRFRWARGADIGAGDWAFFYRCYQRTYLEHGNAPYLTPAFFNAMAQGMANHWVLFIAEHDGHPIASSLIAIDDDWTTASAQKDPHPRPMAAYGRYWGALARVDSLHFEACYYQPIEWCIAHGMARFEGGAQGEHKMARALLPVSTGSRHWLAHPAFADAVQRFMARETAAIEQHRQGLDNRYPFRR